MHFLSAQHSLLGGGILAIGATETGASFKVYRFDAITLAHEHTFSNVNIHPYSSIQAITPLEGGRFKITTLENASSQEAIMNYFTGEFHYEDGALPHVEETIKQRVSQDDMTLLRYQYSLQRGGILAIGVTTDATHYNFYRFDATSLALEEKFENIAIHQGDVFTKITPHANGEFLLKTSFYGLPDTATFNYFTGTFSY